MLTQMHKLTTTPNFWPPLAYPHAKGPTSRLTTLLLRIFHQRPPLQLNGLEKIKKIPPVVDPHELKESSALAQKFLSNNATEKGVVSVTPHLHYLTIRPGIDKETTHVLIVESIHLLSGKKIHFPPCDWKVQKELTQRLFRIVEMKEALANMKLYEDRILFLHPHLTTTVFANLSSLGKVQIKYIDGTHYEWTDGDSWDYS